MCPVKPIRFVSPRQQRIHDRVAHLGEGAQAFYRDLLRVADDPSLESASHLAGHLVREIESALQDVLTPLTTASATSATEEPGEGGEAEEKSSHRTKVLGFLAALGVKHGDPAEKAWLALIKSRLHRSAHRPGLDGPRSPDLVGDQLSLLDDCLDAVLDVFEAKYLAFRAVADDLIAKPDPVEADAANLKERMPASSVFRQYVFGHLSNPKWLPLLRSRGFFRNPPPATRDLEEGTIRFPTWPQLQYLEKVSSESPALVGEILAEVPETDNDSVRAGLAKIASTLPEEHLVKLVPKFLRWLSHRTLIGRVREHATVAAISLANTGNRDEALTLAAAILTPADKEDIRGVFEFDFTEAAKQLQQAIGSRWPLEFVGFLADALVKAVEPDEAGRYSTIWRRSVAAASSYQRHEVGHVILDLIIKTAVEVSPESAELEREILNALRARPEEIFRRTAEYLEIHSPNGIPDNLDSRLLDRERFDRVSEDKEYTALLELHFQNATEGTRRQIVDWCFEGPRDEEWKSRAGVEWPSVVDHWAVRRLRHLRAHLDSTDLARLEALEAKGVQIEDEEEGAVWVGPTSSISVDAISEMTVPELADYLRKWIPKSGWREATPDGLSRAITEAVKRDPLKYSVDAYLFCGTDSTYVRGVLDGFSEAIRAGGEISWDPVLNLCQWTVSQTRTEDDSDRHEDKDPHWGWARKTVCRLLKTGFDLEVHKIGFHLRERAWACLSEVLTDHDPSADRASGAKPGDAYGLAINSVRGEAVQASIRYAVWVKKNLSLAEKDPGLRHMPEVAAAWERATDWALQPPAIAAAFGQAFLVLWWIDAEWATAQSAHFFAREPDSDHADAAWQSYVMYGRPSTAIEPILSPYYHARLGLLIADEPEKLDDYQRILVDHIMTLAWHGAPGANEAASKLISSSSGPCVEHTIDFIGRSLNNSAEVAPEVQDRLKHLWDLAKISCASRLQRLRQFGWWFASQVIDTRWLYAEATWLLSNNQPLEPDHLVAEKLAVMAPSQPLEAIQLLKGMCENLSDEWTLHSWIDEGRTILESALSSDSQVARDMALEIINRMASKGYDQWTSLARSEPSSDQLKK